MMSGWIIYSFIVYGITLIIVQGTIFDGIKIQISKWIKTLEDYLYPNDEEIYNLIEKNDKAVDPKLISMYNDLIKKVEGLNPDTKNFQEVVTLLDNTRNIIKNKIIASRSSWLKKALTWSLIKLQKLIGCMMCTSFWVATFIFIVTLFIDISMFGISLNVVSHVSLLNTTTTGFLVACMLSGTTWIIHSIIDTIYSYNKNN